jgi:hypothetical protein
MVLESAGLLHFSETEKNPVVGKALVTLRRYRVDDREKSRQKARHLPPVVIPLVIPWHIEDEEWVWDVLEALRKLLA